MKRLLTVNPSDQNHMKLFILVNPENLETNLFYKFINAVIGEKRNKNHFLLLLIKNNHEKTETIRKLNFNKHFHIIEELDLLENNRVLKIKKDIKFHSKSKKIFC